MFKGTADLPLTKAASRATPTLGSTVTYTLTVTNAGPATTAAVRASGASAALTYQATVKVPTRAANECRNQEDRGR